MASEKTQRAQSIPDAISAWAQGGSEDVATFLATLYVSSRIRTDMEDKEDLSTPTAVVTWGRGRDSEWALEQCQSKKLASKSTSKSGQETWTLSDAGKALASEIGSEIVDEVVKRLKSKTKTAWNSFCQDVAASGGLEDIGVKWLLFEGVGLFLISNDEAEVHDGFANMMMTVDWFKTVTPADNFRFIANFVDSVLKNMPDNQSTALDREQLRGLSRLGESYCDAGVFSDPTFGVIVSEGMDVLGRLAKDIVASGPHKRYGQVFEYAYLAVCGEEMMSPEAFIYVHRMPDGRLKGLEGADPFSEEFEDMMELPLQDEVVHIQGPWVLRKSARDNRPANREVPQLSAELRKSLGLGPPSSTSRSAVVGDQDHFHLVNMETDVLVDLHAEEGLHPRHLVTVSAGDKESQVIGWYQSKPGGPYSRATFDLSSVPSRVSSEGVRVSVSSVSVQRKSSEMPPNLDEKTAAEAELIQELGRDTQNSAVDCPASNCVILGDMNMPIVVTRDKFLNIYGRLAAEDRLRSAVKAGSANAVQKWLSLGARPDGFGTAGWFHHDSSCSQLTSTLMMAVGLGDLEKVKLLLEAGANPKAMVAGNGAQHPDSASILELSIVSGNSDLTLLLLDSGADLGEGEEFRSGLLAAAAGGMLAVFKRLLEAMGSVDAETKQLVVTIAARRVFDYVLSLDGWQDVPLSAVCRAASDAGNYDTVLHLVKDRGVEPVLETPAANFTLACLMEDFSRAGEALAVEADKKPKIARAFQDEVLLYSEQDLQVTPFVDRRGPDGSLALHHASSMGLTSVVEWLLTVAKCGGVNMVAPSRATPLSLACRGGHFETARLLIKHKARVVPVAGKDELQAVLACGFGGQQIEPAWLTAGGKESPQRSHHPILDALASGASAEQVQFLFDTAGGINKKTRQRILKEGRLARLVAIGDFAGLKQTMAGKVSELITMSLVDKTRLARFIPADGGEEHAALRLLLEVKTQTVIDSSYGWPTSYDSGFAVTILGELEEHVHVLTEDDRYAWLPKRDLELYAEPEHFHPDEYGYDVWDDDDDDDDDEYYY